MAKVNFEKKEIVVVCKTQAEFDFLIKKIVFMQNYFRLKIKKEKQKKQ